MNMMENYKNNNSNNNDDIRKEYYYNKCKPEWDKIFAATQTNNVELIKFLVQEKNVNPSHCNVIGQTSIHIAAVYGHVEAIDMLINLGANVNAKNKLTGATPLHTLVHTSKSRSYGRRIQCIILLLDKGKACKDIFDFDGRMPVDYCIKDENNNNDDDHDDDDEINQIKQLLLLDKPKIFMLLDEIGKDNNGMESSSIVFQQKLSQLIDDNNENKKTTNDGDIVNTIFDGQTPLSYVINKIIINVQNSSNDKNRSENYGNNNKNKEKNKNYIKVLVDIVKILLENGANDMNSDRNISLIIKDVYKNIKNNNHQEKEEQGRRDSNSNNDDDGDGDGDDSSYYLQTLEIVVDLLNGIEEQEDDWC